jgi:hypothetical protein
MTSMLFIHLCRQTGLSWLFADVPSQLGPASRGTPAELARAVNGRPVAVISWSAAAKASALAKTGALPAVAAIIELAAPAPAPPFDALAAATAYYTISPALLKLGCPKRPGEEQWRFVNLIRCGYNVQCTAVAGAGKTTTLRMCASGTDSPVLLLTYNKRLQLDVARSAPKNMNAQTYHAAAGAAYGCVARDSDAIVRCVRGGPATSPQKFSAIYLDEGQDISVELHALVIELYTANPEAQIAVVGDTLQAINGYRGAHPGFLTEAPELYAPRPPSTEGKRAPQRLWASCRLGVSYRLTPATAAFVNRQMYRADVLVGGNTASPNRKPLYIAASGGKDGLVRALAAAVNSAVAEFGPDGVFVLAPSVRNLASKSSPVAELVRHHLGGIPTFVGAGDGEKVDDDVIRGKLAVISINSSKGCERDCVIMAGLDETYFKFFEREWKDPDRLPNVLTVGATRARKFLILVTSARETLRTIDVKTLKNYADVRGSPTAGKAKKPRPQAKSDRPIDIAKFVRHLHPETIRAAMKFVVAETIDATDFRDARAAPTIDGRVRFGEGKALDMVEDLRFVYAMLAPVLAEVASTGETKFGEGLESPEVVESAKDIRADSELMQITEADFAAYPPTFWEDLSLACSLTCAERTPAEWARIAIAVRAIREGRHHTARQVVDYNWVDETSLIAVRDIILRAITGRGGRFDVQLTSEDVKDESGTIPNLYGRAHYIDDSSGDIWEFKLDELCEGHELYLACLVALQGGPGDGVLMSILHRDVRRVAVIDAAALLATLAAGTAPETRTAAELVEAFRLGTPLDAADDTAGADPEAGDRYCMDDVFDD